MWTAMYRLLGSLRRYKYLEIPARLPVSLQTTWLILLASAIGSFLFFYTSDIKGYLLYPTYPKTGQRYLIQTEGCKILAMEPFSDEVRRFYKPIVGSERKKWECPHMHRTLLKQNRTHIWVVKENIADYNITDLNSFSCCSQKYYRTEYVDDVWDKTIDNRVKYEDCVNFTESIRIQHEFVKVTCYYKEDPIHINAFLFAPKKDFKRYDNPEINETKFAYNVIIVGIDSISRLNFHRTMPKTLNFLQRMSAVELLGYTVVARTTYPNMVALLTGAKEKELNIMCHLHRHVFYDFCPLLWIWYKKVGYYTAYGEDTDGIFTYLEDGFFRKPTDYYMHTYTAAIPASYDWNKCATDRYFYRILLDYVEDILWTLRTSKVFGFFWSSSFSHDKLNAPTLMDDEYLNFFKRLNISGSLINTFIFLISDHGLRFGDIRFTEQGRLEQRLPFAFLLTPLSFKKKYNLAFSNLELNAKHLTSPFDLHETIMDLRDLDKMTNESITTRSKQEYGKRRGISLFLPIPENRTCGLAGIPEEFCACTQRDEVWRKAENEAGDVKQAAAALLTALNGAVRAAPQCAVLALERVEQALERVGSWRRELRLVLRTRPGGGLFEGTLRARGRHWQLAGSLARINSYGNQSHCVHEHSLRPYCYCRNI